MAQNHTSFITKLGWNLPWLSRYPWSRTRAFLEQTAFEKKHIIITVANHFEPGWSENGVLDHKMQMQRLKAYHKMAREIGEAVRDADGRRSHSTLEGARGLDERRARRDGARSVRRVQGEMERDERQQRTTQRW